MLISHLKGPKHAVNEKENKRELTYGNFVAIDGIIRNQLDRCATGCNT
jgi:hypothetical protein